MPTGIVFRPLGIQFAFVAGNYLHRRIQLYQHPHSWGSAEQPVSGQQVYGLLSFWTVEFVIYATVFLYTLWVHPETGYYSALMNAGKRRKRAQYTRPTQLW